MLCMVTSTKKLVDLLRGVADLGVHIFVILFIVLAFYAFWSIVIFLEHSLKCILSSVMMR